MTNNNLKFGFVVLVVLVSIRLWSFIGIEDKIYDYFEFLVAAFLIFIFSIHRKKANKSMLFKNAIYLLFFFGFLSVIGALVLHNQSIILSLLRIRFLYFYLLYFILHFYNIQPEKLIKFTLIVGVIWALITVIQQFTYPEYAFYYADYYADVSVRSGTYRFGIYRHHYGMFLVLFFFMKFLQTKKAKYLPLFLIGLVGFYYFGTRQFAAAIVISMIIGVFMQKGYSKIFAFIIMSIVIMLFWNFQDILFGSYIDLTNKQLNTDYVRILAAKFFLFDYWPNWFATIIGNGLEHNFSEYGKEITRIQYTYNYSRNDVGLIGTFNKYGIFFTITLVMLVMKGIKSKLYAPKTAYLRLIFINTFILFIMSEYFTNITAVPFFCIVFYLTDKSYEENRLKQSPIF